MRVVKRRKVWAFCLLVFLIIACGLWLDRRSLFQEGNPATILPVLVRLETSRTKILPVNKRLLLAKMSWKHTAIDHYLASKGWQRNDQWGAILPYHRGKERLNVNVRIYLHGRYWAYELDHKP